MAQASRRLPGRSGCALLLALLCLGPGLAACGGGPGTDEPGLGTVIVRNESDQGQAPLVVVAFFIQPVGSADPGPNRLVTDLLPGAIVIVGLFPAGRYNAEATLDSGASVRFLDVEVRRDAPTNFVVPSL